MAIGLPITPVARGTTAIMKAGAITTFSFIVKHWYIFIIIFILVPNITMAVNTAIETKNPTYPFVVFGLSIINADALIYDDVQILKENPSELIGMEKPKEGYWKTFVYWWNLLLLGWRFAGNLFLISVPFTIAYRYFKFRGEKGGTMSSPSNNFRSALKFGFISIFIVNLVITIVKVVDGTIFITLPENADIFQKALQVILITLPFHGVFSLILYFSTMKIKV